MNPILLELAMRPRATFAEIARATGVSRERVRQIAKKNGFVSPVFSGRGVLARTCPRCGGKKKPEAKHCERCWMAQRYEVECAACGRVLVRTKNRIQASKTGRFYCAKKEGRHENLKITLACSSCGRDREILNSPSIRWAIRNGGYNYLCISCGQSQRTDSRGR